MFQNKTKEMERQLGMFVLYPKGITPTAKASRAAMYEYANSISDVDPLLCKQLKKWADKETQLCADKCRGAFRPRRKPRKRQYPPRVSAVG